VPSRFQIERGEAPSAGGGNSTITQLERAAVFRREDTATQWLDKLEVVLAQATNNLGEAAPLLAALLSRAAGERYPPLNLTAGVGAIDASTEHQKAPRDPRRPRAPRLPSPANSPQGLVLRIFQGDREPADSAIRASTSAIR
jgi:hypothetical protein